ncbi:hypothetical protein Y032_0319g2375 [Ancylostoma ceylanicum]|uniref:Uncharacterized protein n=1 Tax=Ancylostoma ceylanicum TaxID=53326 RepID=A0A016S0Z1_9BILA|nr:hypothetical protein Y032_0319g2375 [Ancylostoma ceylanicum]
MSNCCCFFCRHRAAPNVTFYHLWSRRSVTAGANSIRDLLVNFASNSITVIAKEGQLAMFATPLQKIRSLS